MDEAAEHRLHRLIFEAATDDVAWDGVVGEIANAFGAAVGFDHHTASGGDAPILLEREIDPVCIDAMLDEYSSPEQHLGLAALHRARPCAPFLIESFIDRATFERDPGVRAFFHPQKFDKAALALIGRENGALSYLSLFRRIDDPAFDAVDLERLRRVAASQRAALELRATRCAVERSAEVAVALGASRARCDAVIFVDRHFRVVQTEALGAALLDAGDGLRERCGRLVSTSRRAADGTEALRRFIAAAAAARGETAAERTFRIRGPSGGVLRLSALPLGPDLRGAKSVVALLVSVLPAQGAVDIAAFAQAFDLTKAETRLVAAFAESGSLAAASEKIGLSRNTAKWHMRNVFQKTGTHTQAGLALLLARFR